MNPRRHVQKLRLTYTNFHQQVNLDEIHIP